MTPAKSERTPVAIHVPQRAKRAAGGKRNTTSAAIAAAARAAKISADFPAHAWPRRP